MSKFRRAARVDDNQSDIVEALRSIPGVTVELGHDDIFVGYKGVNYWFEVKRADLISKKTGALIPSAKKQSQKRLEKEWRGHYKIVTSLDEILGDIGIR